MADNLESAKDGLGTTVASHYNQLQEIGIEARKDTRIFYMRGFNNWVKSTLINDFMDKIRRKAGHKSDVHVLDLGSGKGGDQRKWKRVRVKKVVHTDIAETSVKQSEERYKEMQKMQQSNSAALFEAEFHAVDCTKERLKNVYEDKSQLFDITSCQFVFHYSFESLEQADMMMRNACECLKPGGYFIGTTPDARELMRRLRDSEDNSFGNDVYRVTFDSKTDLPLFGCKYNFHLDGVVDCPEFLVHFGMLEKLADKYGMIPVYKENFASLFEQRIKDKKNVELLKRMSALEEYPANSDKQLVSSSPEAYAEAQRKLDELNNAGEGDSSTDSRKILTISKDEWEAITLYLAFAFQKLGTPAEDHLDRQEAQNLDNSESSSAQKRKLSDSENEDCSSTSTSTSLVT